MKLSFQKKELLLALSKLKQTVGIKTTIVALGCVLIKINKLEPNTAYLYTHDLRRYMSISIPIILEGDFKSKTGVEQIGVSFNRLYKIVSKSNSTIVTLEFDNNIELPQVNVSSGSSTHTMLSYNMEGLNDIEIPIINKDTCVKYTGSLFIEELNKVSQAIDINNPQEIYKSVCISDINGILQMFARDVSRAHLCNNNSNVPDTNFKVLIHKDSADCLQNIINVDDVLLVDILEKKLVIQTRYGDVVIIVHIPVEKGILNNSIDERLQGLPITTVNTRVFKDMMKRVAVIVDKNTAPNVVLTVEEGVLKVNAYNNSIGFSTDSMACTTNLQTPKSITICYDFLKDVLKVVSSPELVLKISDNLNVIIFEEVATGSSYYIRTIRTV